MLQKTIIIALSINPKNECLSGLGIVFWIKQHSILLHGSFNKDKPQEYFPEGHSNYANFSRHHGKTDSSFKEYAIFSAPESYVYHPYMNREDVYKIAKSTMKPWPTTPWNDQGAQCEPYYKGLRSLYAGKKQQALQDVDKGIRN